ncbi:WD40 repeat domain-containing protein [Rhodococcus sp. ACS1]|uniref:WD40 repeat domain-containing protein n=1 Tax=Rhodococcus sp. ACS1 TaxID=2028570 RepID=UPI001C532C03|nr:hypothetical protein [Rhodococcus sp. ACS1]
MGILAAVIVVVLGIVIIERVGTESSPTKESVGVTSIPPASTAPTTTATGSQPAPQPVAASGDGVIGSSQGQTVESLAFNASGTLLATGSCDYKVRLWDFETRTPHGSPLTGHSNCVVSVAFSPDGSLLASSADDGTVLLWDVASHRQVGQLKTGIGSSAGPVAFSPDGRLVAVGTGPSTVLWDVNSRQPIGEPLDKGASDYSRSVFSPDGSTIATSGSPGVVLWSVATQQSVDQLSIASEVLAYTNDGRLLTAGMGPSKDGASDRYHSAVFVWDALAQRQIGELNMGDRGNIAVAFSPDGKQIATASGIGYTSGYTIQVWDLVTLQTVGRSITGQTDGYTITSLQFSPDATMLAGTADSSPEVWVWDLKQHR